MSAGNFRRDVRSRLGWRHALASCSMTFAAALFCACARGGADGGACRRNAEDGFGRRNDVTAEAYGLKDEFPLGVYWAWPHNANNAKVAGMDVDSYLDRSMATLRSLNCDAIWVVNGPYDDSVKFLDLCERHGIKAVLPTAFVEMYYQAFVGDLGRYEKLAADTAAAIGGKAALMGYVLKDEPRLNSVQQTDYFHRLLKRADPRHRDSLVVAITSDIQTYVEDSSLPVLCTDVYLFGGTRSTVMPNTSEAARNLYRATCENAVSAAARRGKNLWIMPQCFSEVWGWNWWDENHRHWMQAGSYVHWRMPTPNETRWQAWEAVRCGAKGVVFFLANPKAECSKADISPGGREYKRIKSYLDNVMKQPFLKNKSNLEPALAELPREQGLMYIGGEPTPAFKALGEAYGKIAKAKKFLLKADKAPFPAFFPEDPTFKAATYAVPGSDGMLGVIVNDDLEEERICRVYMPDNVERVVEVGGSEYALSKSDGALRCFEMALKPGDGAVLAVKFRDRHPGMQLYHEDFLRHICKGRVADFAEMRANISCNNRGVGDLVYRKGAQCSSAPAFTISNLTNAKTANNTILLNVNARERDGNVWLHYEGRGVSVRAVLDAGAKALETDVFHLEANGAGSAAESNSGAPKVALDRQSGKPIAVPVGTTGLEFALDAADAYLREVHIWFTPKQGKGGVE